MRVSELIYALKKMPQDAEVEHLWDGEPRTAINFVYLSKDGRVITADYNQDCYSTAGRPVDAPTRDEQTYWSTPEEPNENSIYNYC